MMSEPATILVIDDDEFLLTVYEEYLNSAGYLTNLASGADQAFSILQQNTPTLILMDVEMPQMDGYSLCRQIKQMPDLAQSPVIFVSARDTLEDRLEAFDAGGEDFIDKPADPKVLLRKIKLAIDAKCQREHLVKEKESYEQMAMTFLDSMGESGVLQNFMRHSFNFEEYQPLLEAALGSAKDMGLECHIQLRYPAGIISRSLNGALNPLEESVLEQVTQLGRLFHFKKRMVVNYEGVTILILNVPDDADIAGRIRDNIAILAESADGFLKTITLRKQVHARAEKLKLANHIARQSIDTLRQKYQQQQINTRMLLQKLIEETENTFIHLGLTDNQEHILSSTMERNSEKILNLFNVGVELEEQFNTIVKALGPE